ncbi:MAG: mhpD [Pseudonocardiales bacterium]|nr:mhpD [Pseudonocardiales bacterium]
MTETMPRADAIVAAAARLRRAAENRQPCYPVRDLLGSSDIALAYDVQQRLTQERLAAGAHIVGRKIGLTSPAVQAQIGVDQPDFGVLFDDMAVLPGTPVPTERLLQPKAEAEVTFILGADLADGPLDEGQVRSAVGYAVAALEIVDSRVRDWDIRITDTVADNASSGLFVLGSQQVGLDVFEPADVTMTLHKDGDLVSTGDGRACLGDPLMALAWLARTAREFGAPLRAGDVVLSGALGPMVAVEPGSTVVAEVSVLGRVSATFTQEQ